MPRPPADASSVAVSGQQVAATPTLASSQPPPPSASRLQQVKDEAEMQQLQLQQLHQQQQQYQLQQQQQAQMQQQQQLQQRQQLQQQLQQQQYSQATGSTSSSTGPAPPTTHNVVASQPAANAAANAVAGTTATGTAYAFPRNSPEFACENVGERVKGKRRKYCPHEVTALVLGVQRYADDSCPWSSILRDPHLGHLFHGRSGVDLKDKWRTLIKTRPELAAYTKNRKNHRKYRPFTATEERALLDGVKKYNGQRNVWSLILIDKELGQQFNDRSNVQLKDKFRTMRRAGTTSSLLASESGAARRPSPAATSRDGLTSPSDVGSALALTATGDATSRAMEGTSMLAPAAATATSRALLSNVTSASQQAASLLVQNSAAMFGDPNLYLAGSFALPLPMSQAMTMPPSLTTTSSRQQSAQVLVQAQTYAQAQAIATAQARAAQVQMQHLRAHGGQQHVDIKQQYQVLNAAHNNGAFSTGIPGYHVVGNQLVPQQALYYQNAQQAHLHQQQLQQQLQQQMQQQRQLQQQQQQQQQLQLAAAIAAASNSSHQQLKAHATGAGNQSSELSRGASGSRGRGAGVQVDTPNDVNSMKTGRPAP